MDEKMRLMGVKIPESLYTRMLHYKAEARKNNGQIVTEAVKVFLAMKEEEMPQLKVDPDQTKLSDAIPKKVEIKVDEEAVKKADEEITEEIKEVVREEIKQNEEEPVVEGEIMDDSSIEEDFGESTTEESPVTEIAEEEQNKNELGEEKVE